jgi:hypothetical protein
VEISGPTRVCLCCEENNSQPVIVLTAKGTPTGGTYQWKAEPPGRVELVQGSESKDRTSVKGLTASTVKNDVTVTVTYTAAGIQQPCSDTHNLTVVKPKTLKVKEDAHFKVEGGVIKPPVGNLAKYMPGPMKKSYVGSILIRFYEVVDQFGDPWKCDGELTEELTDITPPGVKFPPGNTVVKEGIP